MQRILMFLTSHRLDCLRLCIDMLVQGGSAARFSRVVVLCSGVTGRHRAYVESLPVRYPGVKWDIIHGPRGRGAPLSNMQNDCVRRYPGGLYFKIDEDTFVSSDWDLEMERAHSAYWDDPRLSLVSAVVTNNQRGAYHLLTTFPELGEEFTRLFRQPIVTDRMGPVWILPQCAEFMIRRFLNLEEANRELRARLGESAGRASPGDVNHQPSTINHSCFATFSYPFSINCICYDYRHWQEIGGVPEEDENGWGKWIPENGKIVVLATRALVHHYSFFVQQDWLDRTSLLEDIRLANLPGTIRGKSFSQHHWPRLLRLAKQAPRVLKRRLGGEPG